VVIFPDATLVHPSQKLMIHEATRRNTKGR
jgi:hypothetical protein